MVNQKPLSRKFTPCFSAVGVLCTLFLLTACEKPTIPNLYPPVVDVPVTIEEEGGYDNPIASPEAKRGGEFTTWAGGYPKSLNYWLDPNSFTAQVTSLMYEGLAGLHPTENRWVGSLAKSWEVSEDGSKFTFHIDPAAKWSDGRPITAADIRFYYDTMMDPDNPTSAFRIQLERLNPPVVVDDRTLEVTARGTHWANFNTAAGLVAFPKHDWEGKKFTEINFAFPVVSGPYQLEKVEQNQSILLKRRGDWWGRVKKENQFIYNFDYLRFRTMEDRDRALDAFQQGQWDMYTIYTAAIWAQRTNFDEIQKNWIVKQEVFNDEPMGFQGLAINLRKPLFKDKNLREALCYLLNREQINEKIMFNSYFLLNSYYPDLYPEKINPDALTYNFNPDKARELLAASGWVANSRGILAKDGKELAITILRTGPPLPHFNVYLEDLKSVGIDAKIDAVDEATETRRMQAHEYDLIWQAMGASRERDPEPSWSSKIADEPNTSNYTGLRDEVIDALIEEQKPILDIDQRNEILKRIDKRLTETVPYVLLWQSDRNRMLYWNRFGTPKYVLDKYNREDIAIVYWWHDEVKAKALEEARKSGQALPAEPKEVRWQD